MTRDDLIRRAPIAIVGMDCIFPGARDLAAFWRNIVRGVDATSPVPPSRWRGVFALSTARGGFIDGMTEVNLLPLGVMPAALDEGDPEQFLVLSMIHRALLDAQRGRLALGRGQADDEPNHPLWFLETPERTEIVIGRGGYLGNSMELAYLRTEVVAQVADLLHRLSPDLPADAVLEIQRILSDALPPVTSEVTASAIPNLTSGRAANRLGLMGANYTVDAACASSLLAAARVAGSLREGRCDLGIAAGVHLVQKPHFWLAFETLGALSRSGKLKAFSAEADGLVMGEGLGAVILKRLGDAQRDGDRIYAVIRAIGSSSDGRGAGVMTPRVEGEVLAMRRAYDDAGIEPQSVSLVEGHGTATAVGDATELEALHQLFGRDGYPAVALGSVKSMIGHAMPAAGIAALIKTALAVYHRTLPPTLHADRPHPALEDSRFYLNTITRPWISPPEAPRRAGVDAFGFGGINAHLILEEGPEERVSESLTPRPSELILMAAPDRGTLLKRIEACEHLALTLTDEQLGDVAAAQAEEFSHDRAARLAIVASSVAELTRRLAAAGQHLRADDDEIWFDADGICFSAQARSGGTAFLFPGIGFPGLAGGYTARLAELCLHFPEVRRHIDFADGLTAADGPAYPLRHQFFPPPSLRPAELGALEKELAWSERTPAGMMAANQATWSLMRSLGFQPDAVAGFSLGEWSALVASEVLDADDLVFLRRAIGAESTREELQLSGTWAMVAASAEQVDLILHGMSGVSLTMDVSPTQVFIGGETAAVRAALEQLQRTGIWGQELPFPPIHTPLSGAIVERLRPLMARIAVRPPHCAVYSGMSGQPYPQEPDQIREMILEGIRRPVRVRDTIRALYGDSIRIFVQLGSGGKLLTNIQNSLALDPHVALSIDLERRGGLEQLHHLLARLAVLGVPFKPGALFRNRPRRVGAISPNGPSGTRVLSLDPPRLRLSDQDVARLRGWLRPLSPAPAHDEAREGPASSEHDTPATDGPAQEAITLLEDFLALQERHEESEARLLARYLETQRAALTAYFGASAASSPDGLARPSGDGAASASGPLAGEIEELVPGRRAQSHLVLDLDEHLFLRDHTFVRAPETLRPVQELLPTLPLTAGVEILAEAAAPLMPGLRVTGWRDVQASRMITLRDTRALPLHVDATKLSETEVQVAVLPQGHTRAALTGIVLFGPAYPPPALAEPLRPDHPCPHSAEQLYSEGRMFHGPRFQVVTGLLGMVGEGIVAQLAVGDPQNLFAGAIREAPVFDVALADGLGQVAGYKAQLDGWAVYPIGFDRLTLYGPTPPPGSTVRADARCRVTGPRSQEADIDVRAGSGTPWLRIEGWRTWRMLWSKRLQEFSWQPDERALALRWPSPPPAIVFRMPQAELGDIDLEWVARGTLVGEEWGRFRAAPRADFLLGRIAAKDAVRHWVRSHQNRSLHPLEVEIAAAPGDGLKIHTPDDTSLRVSIAHIEDEGIAAVAEGRRVGVDLARISDRGPEFLATAFTPEETSILQATGTEMNAWVHRAWCAKEAAAKAAGLGLASLPSFRVRRLVPAEGIVLVESPEGAIATVHTAVDGDRAIAVTVVDDPR